MTYNDVDKFLLEINYYNNFKTCFLNKKFEEIDYGIRTGKLRFDSVFNASDQFSDINKTDESIFEKWNEILNNKKSTEEELLVAVLEIFIWGDVLKGNVKKALDLYRNKKLKLYIQWIEPFLSLKRTIDPKEIESANHKIIWSSGWTKVYSFINNDFLIYDSRVSAFLNYTLIDSNEPTELFQYFAKNLNSFNGASDRERQVDKSFGFKNQSKDLNRFNANIIASFIVQLLNDRLNLNQPIRVFERAFFMLGFDLAQL